MTSTPHLNEDQSFVDGRSEAKARELMELAEKAGLGSSVVSTTSHGYIVPSSLLESHEDFDPSEHSVAEVREYLDGADDDERERVLAAESSGKNRKAFLKEGEK